MKGALITAGIAVLAVVAIVAYAQRAGRRDRLPKEIIDEVQLRSDGGVWFHRDQWPFGKKRK